MKIGKVRRARLGEIPTHYAFDHIEAGAPVIAQLVESSEPRIEVEIVQTCAIHEQAGRGDEFLHHLHRPKKSRSKLYWIAAAALAIIAAGLTWTFTHASTLTYTAPTLVPVEKVSAVVTAYTSSEDETDDTPFITASGSRTGPGVVACPSKYPFGTKVEIAGREYVCEDRMARRYRDGEYFDIWVETKREAFAWGRKELLVIIR